MTEKVWKTHFGIVRFNSDGGVGKGFLYLALSCAHAHGVVYSYKGTGVPVFQTCPLGQVHKSGCAILCAFTFACPIKVYLTGKRRGPDKKTNVEPSLSMFCIMNKNFFILALSALGVVSCGSSKFAVTSAGENLSALTKVTDGEESCITPFGGDNGKNLFYAQGQDKGKYYNIFKKENPFASASIQKTSGKNLNYAPTYCEATDRIAFRCQNEGMSSSDIYMMSGTQGKALTQVTETTSDFENNPCFSSDGTYLVYDKQTYEVYKKVNLGSLLLGFGPSTIYVENSDIWVKNLKTGESTLIGKGYQPCFSPDDKQIAYVKYSTDAKSTSIYIMNIDGTNQIQVTDAKKGYAYNPRWSPDGKKIIFQATKKDKKDSDIYVVGVDGENLTQLTMNKSTDIPPYWTTDGYIYFASDRGDKKGNYQIWRFKYE